jgi:hypothetical protein
MSPFMSSMPPPGLMEMPPESKITPLPIRATGASPAGPPFQRMITTRGSRTEPWATASSAPMPSSRIRAGSSTSISTPSFDRSDARRANSSGKSTFGGSFTRSRARITLSESVRAFSPARAAPWSASSRVSAVPDLSSASGFFLVL